VQCRERWTNVLDPSRSAAAKIWTAEADARLVEAVKTHSFFAKGSADSYGSGARLVDGARPATPERASVSWARVAIDVGGDVTDKLCRNRFVVLRRAEKRLAKRERRSAELAASKVAKAAAKAAKAAARRASARTKAPTDASRGTRTGNGTVSAVGKRGAAEDGGSVATKRTRG
jgi:hypothetical protein